MYGRRELVWRRDLWLKSSAPGSSGPGTWADYTGVCLADVGHRVTCVDKDEGRIAELREGQIPIYEPGLEELVAENSRRRRLLFSADLPETVRDADVHFIAVDTP